MNVKKLTRSILAAALLSGVCLSAQAGNCMLGTSCYIPSYSPEPAVFSISPVSGNYYLCTATSDSEQVSLKIDVSGGKDFVMTHGNGYYKARPSVTFVTEGYFKPRYPYSQGEIRITPYSGSGRVTCYQYSHPY